SAPSLPVLQKPPDPISSLLKPVFGLDEGDSDISLPLFSEGPAGSEDHPGFLQHPEYKGFGTPPLGDFRPHVHGGGGLGHLPSARSEPLDQRIPPRQIRLHLPPDEGVSRFQRRPR